MPLRVGPLVISLARETRQARTTAANLAALLDRDNLASGVWADTAYRSAANLALLDRRGLVAQFLRAKPRDKPISTHVRRGNATRAKVRAKVEQQGLRRAAAAAAVLAIFRTATVC